MLKKIAALAALAFALSSCSNKDCCKAPEAQTDASKAEAAAGDGKHFGATIAPDGAMSYDDLLAKMSGDSMPAKVVGKVDAVCQVKGCWMDFVSEKDPSAQKMKVKFKDYAFFMPKDCAGKRAVVDGYAYTQVTSVEELKHMAEDAGKSKAEIDAIKAPQKELQFMASGVVFVD